jgi:hypothetical protein
MTTESMPPVAFEQWKLAQEHPYILGEFVSAAMDYLGESGAGSWSARPPEQAAQAGQFISMMKQFGPNMGADEKNPIAAWHGRGHRFDPDQQKQIFSKPYFLPKRQLPRPDVFQVRQFYLAYQARVQTASGFLPDAMGQPKEDQDAAISVAD